MRPAGTTMSRASKLLVLAVLAAAGCAGRRVALPPAVDLTPLSTVGLAGFTCNEGGTLEGYVTRRFLEYVLTDQSGTRIVERQGEGEG